MSEWQPIETLPQEVCDRSEHDCRAECGRWTAPSLLWFPKNKVMLVGQYDAGMLLMGDDERCHAQIYGEPTHWMPLPPSPTPEPNR